MRTQIKKWGLFLMMMLATTLIYLDRQTVGLVATEIKQELGIDNAGLGWAFAAFYYSYTLGQFGVGLLLDRYSLRWFYGGAILAWAGASALTGRAHNLATLVAFRILLGIVESGNWPGAMRIVSRYLPPRERPLGNGIFTSGTSVGALIAPALVLGLSGWVGWRHCFTALGLLGSIWYAGWILVTRGPELAHVWRAQPGEKRQTSNWQIYRSVVSLRQFWRVFVITISVNPTLYFFLNWLPIYYRQERGLTAGTHLAGILTLTYLALDIGYLSCGLVVLLLTRRGISLRAARRMVLLGASLSIACAGLVGLARSPQIASVLLIVAVFGTGLWISMYLTLAQEVSPAYVSTAAGLLGGSGSLAGALYMQIVGRVSQTTGSFVLPFSITSVMAAAAAVAGWLATRQEPRA